MQPLIKSAIKLEDGVVVVTTRGRVLLSKTEALMFELLLKRVGRYVSRETIYDYLYQDRCDGGPFTSIIGVRLCKIRKKLTAIGVKISNAHGQGWMLQPELVAL